MGVQPDPMPTARRDPVVIPPKVWQVTKASIDRTAVHLVAGQIPADYNDTWGADVETLCGRQMRVRALNGQRQRRTPRVAGPCVRRHRAAGHIT